MTDNTLFEELYRSALPSVPDEPARAMPRSLYGYVFRVSARQQVRLFLLTVLVFPLTMVPLELQRRMIDEAVGGGDLSLLLLFGTLYFGVLVVQGGLKYVRNVYVDRTAEGVTRLLRKRTAESETVGAEPNEGTKQSIISSESETVGGFVAQSLAFPMLQTGIILSVGGYMLVVDPVVAAVALGFLLPSVAVVSWLQPVLNRLSEEKIQKTRDLGERIIQNGQAERTERKDSPDDMIEVIYGLRVRFSFVKHAMKALNNFFGALGPLAVLVAGGWLVIQGETEVGTIVAFISGYERMIGPARDLLKFHRQMSMMRVQYHLIHRAAAGRASA